ncbi:MAG: hypothetical protein FJ086_03025 [Deltaproteobacteria bacterium]|nr:hypothetical protein [Deltaproteobacteria bacterium]
MRASWVLLPGLSSWVVMGCGGAGPCTVTQDAATGVATIRCPDGSSAAVAPGADGADGTNGSDGRDGATGQTGETDSAGTRCTVTRDAEAGTATSSCADGTTATVADGAVGSQGDKGETGSAGTNCTVTKDADAGVTTLSCADGTTATVLDGQPGAASLLEPSGVNCPAGGTAVLTGLDTSRNGQLEPGEVMQTKHLCAGTAPPCPALEGNYAVRSTLDWRLLAQSGCEGLTGELLVEAPASTVLTPPASQLRSAGTLRLANNPSLLEFGAALPALQSAGAVTVVNTAGAFELGPTAVQSLALGSLASVTGRLRMAENGALQGTADTPAVDDNAALSQLSLPELRGVGGVLSLRQNPALRALSLPRLG